MRLPKVEAGHRLKEKMILKLIGMVSPMEPPDILKTCFYRPEFFGKPLIELVQQVMRGPSEWTVGERELFAALVSRLNQCPF